MVDSTAARRFIQRQMRCEAPIPSQASRRIDAAHPLRKTLLRANARRERLHDRRPPAALLAPDRAERRRAPAPLAARADATGAAVATHPKSQRDHLV